MVDSRPATDSAREPDRAARALAGTWDLLTVATEGANPPETERWKLRLVSTTSDVWFKCPAGPCRTRRVAVIAGGAPVRPSIAFDSVAFANRRSSDGALVEARYDVHDNHLSLSGPPVMDAGTFYNVAEVSDSTMRGRWTDGSYIDAIIPRGNTVALEHQQGYFCARRLTVSSPR
ncbi:MAG TPA: hypothetical protein VH277_13105 [Gemmatimonadaceae bacterium]|jgi:hypothetical protein|nr:hypothetical protein [Gemmatimonadaceae bacterium]